MKRKSIKRILMRAKSKIAKGKRMEEFVSKEIEAEGLGKSIRTPGSGSGNRFKGDLFNNLDFIFEIKNQKKIHILDWIDQAKNQADIGNWSPEKWVLIFKDPRSPEANPEVYAVIDFWEWLKLLKKNSEPRIKEPDREIKYRIQKVVDSAKQLLKALE